MLKIKMIIPKTHKNNTQYNSDKDLLAKKAELLAKNLSENFKMKKMHFSMKI